VSASSLLEPRMISRRTVLAALLAPDFAPVRFGSRHRRFVANSSSSAPPAGLPDPRPTALRRLAWELERRTSLIRGARPSGVGARQPELFHYPLVLLSGDRAFSLPSEAEVARLRRFLTFGGACWSTRRGSCGGAFDASVRQLLARVLPGDMPARVPDEHVAVESFYILHGVRRVLAAPTSKAWNVIARLAVIYTQNESVRRLGAPTGTVLGARRGPRRREQREQAFRFRLTRCYALCLDYRRNQAHMDFIMRTRRARPGEALRRRRLRHAS